MRADISLVDLMVDPENPRLEVQTGSREAVRALFKEHGKKMLALAEDISDRGCVSPLEKIGVSVSPEHKERYIVGEGNRRVAALLALNTPEIVKGVFGSKSQEKLRSLSGAYLAKDPPDTLECEILSKEELQQWIALRHSGENEGAGLVPWGPTEQGRYLSRTAGRKPIELQFIDRFLHHTQGDASSAKLVKSVPTSTLKRLFTSVPVREKLGISVDENGWARSDYPYDEIHKWLARVIRDLSEGRAKSRDLNTTKQMTDYVDSFAAHELPNPKKELRTPIPVEPVGPVASSASSPKGKKGTAKAKPWSLKELKIRPVQTRLKDIIGELEAVSFERINTHAVMLRVFVDLATEEYIEAHSLIVPAEKGGDVTLKAKINFVARRLKDIGKLKGSELAATTKMSSNNRFFSVNTLQQFVHNPSLHPLPSDVISIWKTLGPFLVGMQDR